MKKYVKAVVATIATITVLSFSVLGVWAANGEVIINSTNFPDKGFMEYIKGIEENKSAGFNGDGILSKDEIKLINEIRPDSSVKSVVGIEKLTSVKKLYLGACSELTTLDLSKNTELTHFSAAGTKLKSISFNKNTKLISINLRKTQISSVDVTMCPNLRNLNISDNENRIKSVDISKNTVLFDIVSTGTCSNSKTAIEYKKDIDGNNCVMKYDNQTVVKTVIIDETNFPDAVFRELVSKYDTDSDGYFSIAELETIDSLSKNDKTLKSLQGVEYFYNLSSLAFSNCSLTNIDLSKNKNINYLELNGNNLSSIDISKNENLEKLYVSKCSLSSLDLSNNTKLKVLNCSKNNLSSLNISHLTSLEELNCGENSISSIDVSCLVKLKELSVYTMNLTSLDVSKNTELRYLDCSKNSISYLDLKNNAWLQTLYCTSNHLTNLDLSSNFGLTYFYCNNNDLTELSVSSRNLKTLNCVDNNLSSLDLSKCETVSSVGCCKNRITNLNLSGCSNLDGLDCTYNKISSLDLSDCKKLRNLYCSYNLITDITLNSSNLWNFNCSNNKIKNLDLSNNTQLYNLDCSNNEITSINLKNCKTLGLLDCVNNYISELDLSSNENLDFLVCYGNKISKLDISNTLLSGATLYEKDRTDVLALPDKLSYFGTLYIFQKELGGNLCYEQYLLISDRDVEIIGLKTPYIPASDNQPTPLPTPTPTTPSSGNTGGSTGATGSTGSTGSTTPVNIDVKKVDGFAERLYTKCLNRASDPNGKLYWISQLKAGVSGADVAKQFFYSPEFVGFGLNDQEYVTRLYRTFMDREPDQTGMDFWLSKLAEGKGRDYVFYGFVNSTEWANICLEYGIVSGGTAKPTISRTPSPETIAFATRLYTTCMCRPADAAGVDYWAKELSNMRRSGTQVAYEFFFSKEFIDYGVSDDEYINRLYQTFMGRAADSAGFAYWQGELKNSDRKTILYRFAGCQEFADICSAAGIIR